MKRKWLAIGIILLFVGTCILPTVMASNREKTVISSTTETLPFSGHCSSETELKYYTEENLDQLIGVTCFPCIWKTAIRLTQDEMAAYKDWTMTKVNVAFSAEHCPSIDVRIYIYNKGTNTHPGPIIVSDTAYTLNTTGVTTIPLVTPVNLNDHEELWVAVEWNQLGPYWYAWMDTLSGPHVTNKSDFVYLGSWQQLHDALPTADGRWGIGAIIEGQGVTQLAIGNIKGPMGIKADVQNIGGDDATDVQWSMTVIGGLLKQVNTTTTGTAESILVNASMPIWVWSFIGFGKISLVITAKAQNALEVKATKSAFLLGPFVVGIK